MDPSGCMFWLAAYDSFDEEFCWKIVYYLLINYFSVEWNFKAEVKNLNSFLLNHLHGIQTSFTSMFVFSGMKITQNAAPLKDKYLIFLSANC